MKALVIEHPEKMHLVEREKPVIGEGEALIRVQYIGICGTDIHVLHGHHPTATFPRIPGHEFVGELVEIKGEGSEQFEIGDTVAAQELITCGICDSCAKGEDNACVQLKIIGVHADGGFAEYVKVKTKKLFAIPKDIDLKRAALIEPLAVAVHDVRMSGMQVGENVLVIGGGPIGLLIGLVAQRSGAGRVVVSEVVESRRKLAEEFGFIAIDPVAADFEEKLLSVNGGRMYDIGFEAAGVPNAVTTLVDYVKNTGTIVQIAMTKGPYPVDTGKVFAKELRIQGVRIHNQYNFGGAVRMVIDGVLDEKLDKLISRVFDLEEVTEAFEYAEKCKDAFKVLVKVGN